MAGLGGSRLALALETDGLVGHEVTCDGVGGSGQSEANDNTEGDQLGGDLAELAQSLGDGVTDLVLGGNGGHLAHSRAESAESERRTHFDGICL